MSIPMGVSSRKRIIVKIKPMENDLVFTGTNFRRFLERLKLAVEVDGAQGYDMVKEIIGFVEGGR